MFGIGITELTFILVFLCGLSFAFAFVLIHFIKKHW